MKYGYYPGCSLLSTSAEYARSAEAVLRTVDVDLEEVPDWVCCGATAAHATSHLLSVALPAITCAQAEKHGQDKILTCCTACYSRLKQANHELREDEELLRQTNEIIEEEYKGSVDVVHLVEVLLNDVGLEKIRDRVRHELKGLKVACYYGCLIARLPEALRIDAKDYPMLMDELIAALGAEPVDWPFKTECCGAALTLARQDAVVRLSGRIVDMARECGADVIAVVCPLCQANLDMYQSDVELKTGKPLGIPVLFFTQLMALAMDLSADEICLDKTIVDPVPILAEKGLVQEKALL